MKMPIQRWWRFYLLTTLGLFSGYCRSKDLNVPDNGGDPRFTAEEGFIGENVLVLKGQGLSSANLKSPAQKEAYAKAVAREEIMRKFDEICNSLDKVCPSWFSSHTARKNPTKTKVRKAICTPESDLIRCWVSIGFERENIKQRCQPLAAGETRRSDICNAM